MFDLTTSAGSRSAVQAFIQAAVRKTARDLELTSGTERRQNDNGRPAGRSTAETPSLSHLQGTAPRRDPSRPTHKTPKEIDALNASPSPTPHAGDNLVP